MIARVTGETVQLITQPDHARLARRVMEQCVPLSARDRRDDILHAIGEHDNGWAEPDAAPVVDPESGGLADFIRLPLTARHEVWRRGVARLADRPWAAALVAHHAITVYDRYREDPAWEAFFADMAAARASMIAASRHAREDLDADYVFVRLGDLISLVFCTASDERPAFGGWSVARDVDSAGRVVVSPDIFDGAVVPVAVDARELPVRRWHDDQALRDALSEAPRVTITGEVSGARVTTFAKGSKARLTRHDLDRFPGTTLFDRAARAVCEAGCLPRKELYEAWEVARRTRRLFRGGRVVDLAAGHGLLAHFMLLLDDTSPGAIAADTSLPASSEKLREALVAAWPRLDGRVTFVGADVDDVALDSDDVVVSSHACGALTDRILDRAAAAGARVSVLPCCHDLDRGDAGGLSGWIDGALAIDVMRAVRLEARGYRVWTQTIPGDITPKNRLLLAEPRS